MSDTALLLMNLEDCTIVLLDSVRLKAPPAKLEALSSKVQLVMLTAQYGGRRQDEYKQEHKVIDAIRN